MWATLLQHEDNGGRAEIRGRARHRRGRGAEEGDGRKVPRVRREGRGGLREGVSLVKADERYASENNPIACSRCLEHEGRRWQDNHFRELVSRTLPANRRGKKDPPNRF